jgi:hypothetical protein
VYNIFAADSGGYWRPFWAHLASMLGHLGSEWAAWVTIWAPLVIVKENMVLEPLTLRFDTFLAAHSEVRNGVEIKRRLE